MSADAPAGAGSRRLITADEVGLRGLTLVFEADAEERAALGRRLDLMSLEALTAQLRFEPADEAEGAIRVTGTIRARLVQSCVVTLEPVPRTLSEPISVLYAPPPAEQPEHEVEVLAEGDEAEPLPETASMWARWWRSISPSSSTPIRATRMRRRVRSPIQRATTRPKRTCRATTKTLDPSQRLAN